MRCRLVGAVVASFVLATSLAAGPVAAAPPTPPHPPAGQPLYTWLNAGCVRTVNGDRHIARIRTQVYGVPELGKTYYQKITIQTDRLGIGGLWRKFQERTFSKPEFKVTARNVDQVLPTYSTTTIKTGLYTDGATVRAKVKVYLKKVDRFRDTTVWAYSATSSSWDCDFGGRGRASVRP